MNRGILKWVLRLGAALASTVFALAFAEGAATLIHHAAFPYLNIFEADARYGARLQSNATTRLRSRSGRVTTVKTNSGGWRGPEWKPAVANRVVDGRVLLLGDSQMFAYGVDEEDSTAARMRARAEVLNGSIPTWGPRESILAMEDVLPRFRPQHVVWVINVANDWFESPVPNVKRTSAQDGWAATVLPNMPAPASFPLRSLIMGRSHLALAARTLVSHAQEPVAAPADMALRLLKNVGELNTVAAPNHSRLTAHVLAGQRLCAAYGCTFSVAILPMDVQVHPDEWRKYRSSVVDMTPVHALVDSLVVDLKEHQVPFVDLLPALQAASPGAFLNDDYHLSPSGHAVVAHSLEALMHVQVAGVVR